MCNNHVHLNLTVYPSVTHANSVFITHIYISCIYAHIYHVYIYIYIYIQCNNNNNNNNNTK